MIPIYWGYMEGTLDKFNLVLLPVMNTVVFPKSVMPFQASDKHTVKAIKEAINNDKNLIFLSTIIPKNEKSQSETNEVYKRGVLALIKNVDEISDNSAKIVLEVFAKADVISQTDLNSICRVDVEILKDANSPMTEEHKELVNVIKNRVAPYCIPEMWAMSETPEEIISMITTMFETPIGVLQKVLEQNDDFGSLMLLNEYINLRLNNRYEIKDERTSYQNNIKESLVKENQFSSVSPVKDLDAKSEEIEELNSKLKKIKFPPQVKKEVDKQVIKLSKLNPEMSEYYLTRNYIDWLSDIPWGVEDKSDINLGLVEHELNSSHYGLDDLKERILEFLAVMKLNKDAKGSIICLISPPGCGKTTFIKSIAKALNRKFVKISLGGVKEESEIRGHRRTYVGSMPGKFVQALKQAGTMNPVILLDEIDKLGNDAFRGSPSAALLEALDPGQNNDFSDHYINLGVDLSKVLFIATANDASLIERALYDRLEVINMEGYSEREKYYIATKYLIPEVCKETNLPEDLIKFSDTSINEIISNYTRESGVRELKRKIQSIYRKIAKNIVNGEEYSSIEINTKNISKYLGSEKINNKKNFIEVSGLVNGMAWNGHGGDLLPIEVTMIEANKTGEGRSSITGNLGKVMEESVQVALAYLKCAKAELKINSPNNYDFYIHFPEGAIPKDGPSAGMAITLAIISKMTNKIIPRNYSFTGEITINGNVLPVGGIKEKVLAAKRSGVDTVFIPEQNKKDISKLDSKDVRGMTFNYISHFSQVLELIK